MKTILREECGAGTIIEYTIVLPIVMAVIMVLLFTGYIIHDRATMEASAERVALYIAKTIADTNYETFVDNGDFTASEIDSISISPDRIENDPYRYLFGAFANIDSHSYARSVEAMVHSNQFIHNDTVKAAVSLEGLIFRKVKIVVTERYEMPTFLASLNIPICTIRTEAVAYINEPAEFVRNADLTFELIRKVADATGITEKLSELKSKISFFTNSEEVNS